MKPSFTFNVLAWMALGSYTLALPTASPLLSVEITIKSGEVQVKEVHGRSLNFDAPAVRSPGTKCVLFPTRGLPLHVAVIHGEFMSSKCTNRRVALMTVVGNVHYVNSNAEYDQYKNTRDKLVVVDFTATWCGPCRAIAPKFDALSNTYTQVVFIAVDIDKLSSLPDGGDVSGAPTFKYFKNGYLVTQFSGANAQKLEDTIKANL